MKSQWNDKIFNVSAGEFLPLALEVFHFQYQHNALYREYVKALKVEPQAVKDLTGIPFLPIRFFKSMPVKTGEFEPAIIFESSGTTGMQNSRHLVKDPLIYEQSFLAAFRLFYGVPEEYCVLGLLPSYLERNNSSLVYMVDRLIRDSGHSASGFYLDDYGKLASVLKELEKAGQKTLLIGVTFALLDFAEAYPQQLSFTTVMETGGMKGRKKEMIREEVHEKLRNAFGLDEIHSEYGMTELLSQGYARKEGMFETPPWMRVLLRDEEDPLSIKESTTSKLSGAINVIDLANVNTCSFIATDDMGRIYPGGKFEVLGRMDNSDIRGCSLMAL